MRAAHAYFTQRMRTPESGAPEPDPNRHGALSQAWAAYERKLVHEVGERAR